MMYTNIIGLQRILSAAARIVCFEPKFSHHTPALHKLHWLPLSYRIQFKILLPAEKSNSLIGTFFVGFFLFFFFGCSLSWLALDRLGRAVFFQADWEALLMSLLLLLSEELYEILDSDEDNSSLTLETSDWLSERLSPSAAILVFNYGMRNNHYAKNNQTIGGKVWAGKRTATYVIPFAVNLVPEIARSINTLCHRVKVGDGGSAW